MEKIDVFWLFVFLILFVISTFLITSIRCYIRDKPLGSQSLYDVVAFDDFCFFQFSSSVFTLGAAITRFDYVRDFSAQHPVVITLFSMINVLALTSICIHSSFLAIVRLICLIKITFLEETIGENRVRSFMIGSTISSSLIICGLEIMSGDINTGTPYSLMTTKIANAGIKHIVVKIWYDTKLMASNELISISCMYLFS